MIRTSGAEIEPFRVDVLRPDLGGFNERSNRMNWPDELLDVDRGRPAAAEKSARRVGVQSFVRGLR